MRRECVKEVAARADSWPDAERVLACISHSILELPQNRLLCLARMKDLAGVQEKRLSSQHSLVRYNAR